MSQTSNKLVNGLISPNYVNPQNAASSGAITPNLSFTTPSQTTSGGYQTPPVTTQYNPSNPAPNLTPSSSEKGFYMNQQVANGVLPAPKTATPTGGGGAGGLTPSSPNWYQLQPGETSQAYFQRTQGQSQQSALAGNVGYGSTIIGGGTPQTGGTPSGGTGTPPVNGGSLTPDQMNNAKTPDQIKNDTNPYTAPAPTFPGIVGALAGTASQPTDQYTGAQNTYNEQANQLEALQKDYAQQTSNINGSRTNLAEAGGEQGNLQNLYANTQSAIAQRMSAAQQAAQTATGQQGVQQQGLGAAGSLASPNYLGPGQSPYYPTQGQYGQIAGTQGGQGGLQGIGNMYSQIAIGQSAGEQNAQLGRVQNTGTELQKLITEKNINPNGFTPFNGVVQTIAGYTSNSDYQKFAGQVSDFVTAIAPILGGAAGATTDYKTHLASQILNSWASGQSINDVITYFLTQAKSNIEHYQSGGGATGNSGGGTTSNTQVQPLAKPQTGGAIDMSRFSQNPDGTWKYA